MKAYTPPLTNRRIPIACHLWTAITRHRKPKRRQVAWIAGTLTPVLLFMLCGCSSMALHKVYSGYSHTYADSVNQQLLLNLARLSQDEPPYFIQLGQMNSQFTFNSSAGFMPSQTRVNHPGGASTALIQDTVTLGGTVNAGAVESPTFQFVPLNGETFAQAITAPIPDKLFYTFYDQGFHADVLCRTMVAYVKITETLKDKTNVILYVNQPRAKTYPDFIRFCEDLRGAQTNQEVIVKDSIPDNAIRFTGLKLAEVQAAIAAGFTVTSAVGELNYSNYVLLPRKEYRLELRDSSTRLDAFQTNVYNAFTNRGVELHMRTFIATMYGVAKEEMYWDEFRNNLPNYWDGSGTFTNDEKGLKATIENASYSPNKVQFTSLRPIITLGKGRPRQAPHFSELYVVGDYDEDNHSHTSNRSVFSLLSYLFAELAIDPQKLPVQQLIQVR